MSSSVLSETEGSDIHHVARAVVKGIGLSQHREILNLILARNCCQTPEGICGTKSFACLISNLMMHLGSALEQSSKLLVHRELQYIFLSNNLQFILQQVKNAMAKEPLDMTGSCGTMNKLTITWRNTLRLLGLLYPPTWQIWMESTSVS